MNAQQRVLVAAEFAARKHAGQRRKDAARTPYINHPLSVARRLVEAGCSDEEVLMAGLLHDTIEDCGVQQSELERNFGEIVARYVGECSDDKALPKAERKRLQVTHAAHVSPGARLVKLADKLDNCAGLKEEAPVGWSADRVQGYFVWSLHVCRALGQGDDAVAAALQRQLAAVFAATFRHDGRDVPCVPANDAVVLERYYEEMSFATD